MIDLHIHTIHSSDGQYRPDEIFEMASHAGLKALAFADHMDIRAADRGMALASDYRIEFFSGLEVSTSFGKKEYHLLLYGFDPESVPLREFLSRHCSVIWQQAYKLIEYFRDMGFDLTEGDITPWGRSVPTGVTFLDALKKRNSKDPRLYEYLYGNKAHSPYLSFYQGFSLSEFGAIMTSALPPLQHAISILKPSGILILAHPGTIERETLEMLKGIGLDGIEAYSTHHSMETTQRLLGMARSLELLVSAGSDFHGERIKPDIPFAGVPGQPDAALMKRLRESPYAG